MRTDIARWIADRPLLIVAATSLFLTTLPGCGGSGGSGSSTQGNSQISQSRVGLTSVLTHMNDNRRDGLNLSETTLTPANVQPATFGKVAAFAVQGYVYAQPLYVPNVRMTGNRISNLLIVATQHDQLYAFDVDTKALAWHIDYLAAGTGVSTLSSEDVADCDDIVPEIGITSTPVVDQLTSTVFVLVRTKEVVDGTPVFYQRLHAVDLGTGQELLTPTSVTGPPPDYASTGTAVFDTRMDNQRAALVLANNQVYIAWASHCDITPYMGWLMSFDKRTLQPTAYWTPVPYSHSGGIWLSGAGPSVDENGDLYVPVANGSDHDQIGPKNNYRSSLVRLHWSSADGFNVVDYFAPYNYQFMDDGDMDFGSGAALLLPPQAGSPHPHLLVTRDKVGGVYVLDRDDLGKWQANDNSQAVQNFLVPGFGLSSMLYWNSTLYVAGGGQMLFAYTFDPVTQQFNTVPKTSFPYKLEFRGPTPSLSANGNTNALLWIVTDYSKGKHAVLHALDANDISKELYSSATMPDRDTAGIGVKFVVPTVADGLVFVGAQNEVDMYGLLRQ